MRIVSVNSLKGDEVLGKQIFDDYGRILLNVGIKLTPFYIQKLKGMGILTIYIDDEISKEVILDDSISEKTRQTCKHAINDILKNYSREGTSDNSAIMKSVASVIDNVLSNKNVLINVSEIRTIDNNIYSHSVNVCILATLIGLHMGYNMLKVNDIATGAILHALGKIIIRKDKKRIPEQMKKEELDQYIEFNHPKVGYDFLSEQNFCNAYSKVAVLMHHEKLDGSGYPLNLKGSEISEIAKLISICDTFDNMISGNNRGEKKPIFEVTEYLIAMSNLHFDFEMVKKFTMNIAAFPNGSSVILNSKEKCLVLRQNRSLPLRPVVKVLYDKNGNALAVPYELDLQKELTLFITKNDEL